VVYPCWSMGKSMFVISVPWFSHGSKPISFHNCPIKKW
jgi:hypothetical protein